MERWNEFWIDIINLERFKIDRWIGTSEKSKIQLHGFADSSTAAFGAEIFVRVTHPNGKITCNMLMSKTRVAPLKIVTIPRLELAAAELLARLLAEVRQSMEWKNAEYILWTDSSIALHWIRKQPHELKVFAANRVASIQSKTEVNRWRHIDTKSNPADLLSRGVAASDLVDNRLWLHGPKWIVWPESQWPVSKFTVEQSPELVKEMKVFSLTRFGEMITIRTKENKHVPLLEYVGKLERALNIISFANRFIKNWLSRKERNIRKKKRGEVQIRIVQ